MPLRPRPPCAVFDAVTCGDAAALAAVLTCASPLPWPSLVQAAFGATEACDAAALRALLRHAADHGGAARLLLERDPRGFTLLHAAADEEAAACAEAVVECAAELAAQGGLASAAVVLDARVHRCRCTAAEPPRRVNAACACRCHATHPPPPSGAPPSSLDTRPYHALPPGVVTRFHEHGWRPSSPGSASAAALATALRRHPAPGISDAAARGGARRAADATEGARSAWRTPLHVALVRRADGVVAALLAAGADAAAPAPPRAGPLPPVLASPLPMLRVLMAGGVRLDAPVSLAQPPPPPSTQRGGSGSGAGPQVKGAFHGTPLEWAEAAGDAARVRALRKLLGVAAAAV